MVKFLSVCPVKIGYPKWIRNRCIGNESRTLYWCRDTWYNISDNGYDKTSHWFGPFTVPQNLWKGKANALVSNTLIHILLTSQWKSDPVRSYLLRYMALYIMTPFECIYIVYSIKCIYIYIIVYPNGVIILFKCNKLF